ncbi:restriction endonuclease subunit S [Thauera sp. SWB20]|uniref:restriction endonuclease subunit S n=1 Tax=Thauera sp. SWB20 TaxID=1572758 RepID=UPI0005ADF456|nr:restriction endonuclease subunit S [Thauera sp. SWB20]KIN91017.1 type I restriction modification DNA specificity domain protein [Thauera sp. SWB20]TXH13570.1 MAG: restriction endonuclease subunit S [Gammaproteobacteria bacterium]
MSGNKKQPLVPRLRFPEFKNTAEWQSPTLGEVSEPVEERVGERKLTPVSISAGIGFVPQAEKFGRDISGSQYKLYTVVRDGDFVYNKGNSLKFPQGCVYDLQGWGEVAAPNVFICFRLKNGYENGFYRQCFERNVHGIQLRKHITSGARSNGLLNISKEAFYGVAIPVPSHAEQQKIADCLSSLDDLIAAETYKLDTLKTHKKGLMQQLFPREGETVPRLRFPEFREAGEWKPKTIGNSCESFSGGTPSTTNKSFYGGEIPFIRSAEIDKVKTELFLTNEGLENSAAKLVRAGDILVALYGANSGDVALSKINGAINQAILCLRHETSDRFVYQYLSHKKEWIIATFIQGGQGNLSGEIIKAISLFFPNPSEQEHIADCLSSLDDLITAQTQKIDALKTHKKGLMQQLFPVLDEVGA